MWVGLLLTHWHAATPLEIDRGLELSAHRSRGRWDWPSGNPSAGTGVQNCDAAAVVCAKRELGSGRGFGLIVGGLPLGKIRLHRHDSELQARKVAGPVDVLHVTAELRPGDPINRHRVTVDSDLRLARQAPIPLDELVAQVLVRARESQPRLGCPLRATVE